MYIGLHVKCPLFLSDFDETLTFRQFFEKYINIKFNENPSNGSPVVPYGQTGGQTDGRKDMTKLIAAFHNFVNPSKNAKDTE
jgi:hypothetical protein